MRHFVAAMCAAALLAAAVRLFVPANADAATARLSSAERGVITNMNRIRARHGLRRLRLSRALARAADGHSRDMLRHDFFSHSSRDGTPFHRRVRRYTRARSVGENLALVSGRNSAGRVVNMWLNSPAHRAVLLSPRFLRVGVGRRSGRLGSHQGAVFTADFASRR